MVVFALSHPDDEVMCVLVSAKLAKERAQLDSHVKRAERASASASD